MSEKISSELKKIVLWRLDTIPPNFKLSIGNEGTFTKEELRQHVQKEDQIGVTFAKMQLNFMKALASGEFSKTLAE
jgi:Zn ribbon nucleic-acid-binding protein